MADSDDTTPTTLTTREAGRLAGRLTKRANSPSIAEQVLALQNDASTAGRLIRVMLRQVHSSDVFTLPPAEA